MLFKGNSVVLLFQCFTIFAVSLFSLVSKFSSSVLLYSLLHQCCFINCISIVLFTPCVPHHSLHQYCIIYFISTALFNNASVLDINFISTALFNASVLNHSLHQYFCSGILLVFIWIAFLLDNIYLKHHYVSRLWHNETKVGSFFSLPTLTQ